MNVGVSVQQVKELPAGLDIARDEWHRLLSSRARSATDVPLGGMGGGVQLLTPTEARGRTAERLFILGAVRGVLPRLVPDDPLLPDSLRGCLARDVLPEMPVKARSADEERYLFAQILSASPQTTVSWSRSVDGRRQAPSPFVDRLRVVCDLEVNTASSELSGELAAVPLPTFDHAIADGLKHCGQPTLGVVEAAISEGRALAAVDCRVDAGELAVARKELAAAVEGESDSAGPGPWAGLVGHVGGGVGSSVAVTRLEAIARCPWQAFVIRRLNVAPMPDPLHNLPELTGALVGNLVHGILDEIVRAKLGRGRANLREVQTREAVSIAWPKDEALENMLREQSSKLAKEAGLATYGVAPLLADMARPYLEVAQRVLENDGGSVLGSEVEGTIPLSDQGIDLSFRADRVERVEQRLTLTDFKTGKPVVKGAARQNTMDKRLRESVGSGVLLQGVAYAMASGDGCGRYVSLRPESDPASEAYRWTVVNAEDEELIERFKTAVGVILSGWKTGAMVPRVEHPNSPGSKPPSCIWCSVSEACIRSDSARRRRLGTWLNEQSDAASSEADIVAHELWWLGCDRQDGES